MSYAIDKGVPLPPPSYQKNRYPFAEMAIGDSFMVPVPAGEHYKKMHAAVSASATSFARRNPAFKFATRIVDDKSAIRCWRIALRPGLLDAPAAPQIAGAARVHRIEDDKPTKVMRVGR